MKLLFIIYKREVFWSDNFLNLILSLWRLKLSLVSDLLLLKVFEPILFFLKPWLFGLVDNDLWFLIRSSVDGSTWVWFKAFFGKEIKLWLVWIFYIDLFLFNEGIYLVFTRFFFGASRDFVLTEPKDFIRSIFVHPECRLMKLF